MTTEAERLPKGTIIDGRYQIRGFLGEGGMGTVYRGVDTKMGQAVAIKVLQQSGVSERSRDERRRRFMAEIFAINEVAHRNIVQVLEFGFFKDTPFMVMELLKGRDLGRVIAETSTPLGIDYCVDIMLVVCAAIQACHAQEIIHRDLKPGNVMVIETDSGHGWDVKVLDFSISSISKIAADLTRDGQILGTPRFLSPEQITGKVLPASDQYAIGLLLYVCLTKRHPLAVLDGLPLIRAIERGEIPPPRSFRPDIPEALERVIMTAIHVDPAQRFANVHELGRALWPLGSQLGQSLWKKYYFVTPLDARPRTDPKRSTTGVPLVLQMAQGKVPLNASATALAHYQSTTAVRSATTTVDDPAARAAAEADAAIAVEETTGNKTADDPEARQLGVAGTWIVSESQLQEESAGSADPIASASVDRPARKRQRRALFAIPLAAVVLILGTFAAVRAGRRTPTVEQTSVSSTTPSLSAPPTVMPAIPPPQAPPAVNAKVEPPASAFSEAKPTEFVETRDQHPKHRDHDHVHRKPSKTDDWGVDPFGNPIPPP